MKFDPEKALRYQLIFLAGEESTLRRQALKELIEAASGGDDFDLETFVGDASHPQNWFASAGTAPFLSPRRTAVVRNVLRFDDLDEFKPVQLPETALLILVADEEGGDEEKARTKSTLAAKYGKLVEKAGGLNLIFTVDAGAIVERLRQEAKDAGKDFSLRAAETLKEMCGDRYSRARDELEKLISFVGNEPTITEEHVKAIVVPSREWNIFKLTDAVLNQNPAEAFRQLRILVGGSNKAPDAAFRVILPQLSRQFRLLYQARLVLDLGGDQGAIPAAARDAFPAKPNLTQEKDYPRKLAFQGAKKVRMDQIRAALGILSDCDARLKGQLPYYTAQDSLERMVLELVDALAPAPAKTGRR